jgi:4-hydroxy-tetrahydrodipicolinate synthase
VSEAPEILSGVFCASLTPLNDDLSVNHGALASHCKWLLANGCDGLGVLGTTGEANSFSLVERLELLDTLAENGIAGKKMLPGVGCCAIPDTVELTKKALELGTPGVLMLPPFFYKGVSDDGLFDAYSEIIERVGDSNLRVYLYHIPPQSATPLSVELVGRLIEAFPDTVVGLKDSSGEFGNMKALIDSYPGFAVFSGGDQFLRPVMQAGGAGCITAVCNIAPHMLREIYDNWESDSAGAMQDRMTALRDLIVSFKQFPALRVVTANNNDDSEWLRPRSPLRPIEDSKQAELLKALEDFKFTMPKAV